MPQIPCPGGCGAQVSDASSQCHICGHPVARSIAHHRQEAVMRDAQAQAAMVARQPRLPQGTTYLGNVNRGYGLQPGTEYHQKHNNSFMGYVKGYAGVWPSLGWYFLGFFGGSYCSLIVGQASILLAGLMSFAVGVFAFAGLYFFWRNIKNAKSGMLRNGARLFVLFFGFLAVMSFGASAGEARGWEGDVVRNKNEMRECKDTSEENEMLYSIEVDTLMHSKSLK